MTTAKTNSVWLVNDEEYVRKALAIMLKHGVTGIELKEFGSGVQAWEALAQDKPDLLITADTMVQMRGKDIAEQLFARGDKFPVIVTSAWQGTKEWVEGLAAKGMDIQLLSLPLQPVALWDATYTALGLSPSQGPAN